MAPPTTLPTVLLVPGAWHQPVHYSKLISSLERLGFPTAATKLDSVGSLDPKNVTLARDIEYIREQALKPLLDEGRDVILLMHSFGGIEGSGAAKGLSKAEREVEGKKGGVVGMIWLAGLIMKEGDIWQDKSPVAKDPRLQVDEEAGVVYITDPRSIFYHGVSERDANSAVTLLLPMAVGARTTPSPAQAWADKVFEGRLGYIRCGSDKMLAPALQDRHMESTGLPWEVRTVEEGGHSAFYTHPGEIAKYVLDLTKTFTSSV
ncbi:hypothetical protein BDY21DRAFT_368051 [Lineolata rhizophorae]|uniref:AB hydrolase-1 domain-containing protein n=1 Tax=Lineolata rhizophorae TaxID=578093 RepID=A0A6A6PD53_9PEZI|nr:hypothetical protein BDY21DRAFT_368051 [Lineolata rhizophorae]